jgi:phosphatidylinositol alpha-1,6-mannosyltransferase
MRHNVVVVHLLNPKVLQTYFENFDRRKGYDAKKEFGAVVYRFPSSVKNVFRVFFTVLKATKKTKIDVVHIFSGAYTPIGLLFLLYGKLKRKKNGISLYGKDILSSKHSPVDIILLRISLLLPEKIGVNSKATANLLPKSVHGKISILYPGVDLTMQRISKKPEKPQSEKRILFVGRLVGRKGAHELLQAFKHLQNEMPNIKLVIVGDGPQRRSLEKSAKDLEIEHKVEFAGTLVGEPLFRKYSECDLFVMPSKTFSQDVEGFGMVFLEASLFRKPAIGTWSGGIPEAVVDGRTGLLVEPGNVDELRKAMRLLLTDEVLAKRLGESAYKRTVTQFTWEKAASEFLKMYEGPRGE